MGSMADAVVKHGVKSKTSVASLLDLFHLVVPLVLIALVEVAAATGGFDPNSEQPCSLRDPAMNPTYEVRYGRDVVWQIPSNPKAILVLAPGQGKQSVEYFDPAPNCKKCNGMPETRLAVLEALKRRYAVIALTVFTPDWLVASTIVKEWVAEYSLDGLPVTAWGHSLGTNLVTELTQALPMRCLVLNCGAGSPDMEQAATPLNFPPTLFVYMPRDTTYPNVTNDDLERMAWLTARGVVVAETQCWPMPITPLFFAERIMCMSGDMSRAIYSALDGAGWIDSGGYLLNNSFEDDAQPVLLNANALPVCEATGNLCLIGQVIQELNMAYALHSFTHTANPVIFDWLDSHVLSSSGAEKSDFQSPTLMATI